MALLACEALFGQERGGEIRALVEKLAGGQCPCVQGFECLLLPKEDADGEAATRVLNTH